MKDLDADCRLDLRVGRCRGGFEIAVYRPEKWGETLIAFERVNRADVVERLLWWGSPADVAQKAVALQ